MKYIKKFEKAFNLKIGDIIKVDCVNSGVYDFDGEIGEIINIETGHYTLDNYTVNLFKLDKYVVLTNNEVSRATSEQIEQYELEKNVERYNL